MRLGVICKEDTANSHYRVFVPIREMQRRGHQVVAGDGSTGDGRGMPKIDVVHMHQWVSEDITPLLNLRRQGIAMVWDTDDDVRNAPMSKELKQTIGGRRKVKRFHELSLRVARTVDLVTTTNENLADVFREGGVERVAVIGNYLERGAPTKHRRRHQGVLIGIVAGMEHTPDVKAIRLSKVLRDIQRAHEHVHVVAIGVDLGLKERYRHIPKVPFRDLMNWVREFDLGLAPLADSPFSRARSNVKLKEYSSAGVPWLASPVGPYKAMGEVPGGRLVGDAEWFHVIDELIRDAHHRADLAEHARRWASTQTIASVGGAWEAVFRDAIRRARSSRS